MKSRFVTAPNAQDRLQVTREMLTLVFTYHQLMAPFLDFLFAFQDYASDFHFSEFRAEDHLFENERRLKFQHWVVLGSTFRCVTV